MIKKLVLTTATLALLAPFSAHAEIAAIKPALEVENAYIKVPAPGVTTVAGMMTIYNNTESENALVSVETPVAEMVEIHEMKMDGDVMRMRKVEELEVAAASKTEFSMETGNHLMFINPTETLEEGDTVNAVLKFENGAMLDVEFPVVTELAQAQADHDMHSEHHEMGEADSHEEDMMDSMNDGAGEDEAAADEDMHMMDETAVEEDAVVIEEDVTTEEAVTEEMHEDMHEGAEEVHEEMHDDMQHETQDAHEDENKHDAH